MAAFLNVCRFNPTAGGTTDWTYSTAVTGYQSPALAGVVNSTVYKYRAESADLSQWEIGEGAYNTGTGVLARTTVFYNSSGTGTATGQSGAGTKIAFSATPTVAIIAVKEDLLAVEESNSFTSTQQKQARDNIGITASIGLYNLSFAISASASALTIALKDAAGNDPSSTSPVVVDFHNSTQTSSAPSQLAVTAATSLVISSGSTLGVTSSTAFRLWIVGFNDGGTFRLGVINCSDSTHIYTLNESLFASSTAEGGAGAADSAGVIYTGTAVTSKAFRILGYIEWSASGLTAGTWTTTNHLATQIMGIGIKRPGEVVQTGYVESSGSATTNTSATDVTNATFSITPSSAANAIKFGATWRYDQAFLGGVNVPYQAQFLRGATNLSGTLTCTCGIGVGGVAHGFNQAFQDLDWPNATSSTTYKMQHWSSSGSSTSTTSTVRFVLEEIMA